MREIIEQRRAALPPLFLGSASDELTGRAHQSPSAMPAPWRSTISAEACAIRMPAIQVRTITARETAAAFPNVIGVAGS